MTASPIARQRFARPARRNVPRPRRDALYDHATVLALVLAHLALPAMLAFTPDRLV